MSDEDKKSACFVSKTHFRRGSTHWFSPRSKSFLLITVEKIEIADELSEKIESIGYKSLGDYINKSSRLFVKEEQDTRLVNLDVFEAQHPHVKDMITLRDYFRSHPEVVEEYSKLKFDLVKKYPNDYGLYRKYKDEWMEDLKKNIKK